jgi:peptidoglycan hydrolase CwlO-like protein
MHRCAILALGLATLILASCGGEPPVVQVSGGGEAAQALGYQLVNLQNQVTVLQNQVTTLQRRIDGLEARLPPVRQP